MMKTVVYLCQCGSKITDKIDEDKLVDEIKTLPNVDDVVPVELLCSIHGKNFMKQDLQNRDVQRVVVAACSPRDHETTFKKTLSEAGMNPYFMQIANIREQVAWVTEDRDKATQKALTYIQAAVARVQLHEPLVVREIDVNPDVLILGAGPAGMKAAVTLAQAGRKVTLVEKSLNIGGMPVMYEELFPNLECGPCMLEPLMDQIIHGEFADNIQFLSSSELVELVGFFGNFTATVRRFPRYIDVHSCIGCGECVEACPVSAENPFNCGFDESKAVAFPFAGALPNAPFIDSSICLRFNNEACYLCQQACPIDNTVNYEDEQTLVQIQVGAIIVAIGAGIYDLTRIPQLGYGESPDIYNAYEFERIVASNGPYKGKILKRSGEPPKSICIIHCAGSLEKKHKEYCSGICCQIAFKFNHLIRKQLPDTTIAHLYKEFVFPGKDDFLLYRHAKNDEFTTLIRYANMNEVEASESGGTNFMQIRYVSSSGFSRTLEADMIVLCPAITSDPNANSLAETLDVSMDKEGFFESLHRATDTTKSKINGIYLAGSCLGPMAIQQAMNQGVAAAGAVMSDLIPGKKFEVQPITAEIHYDKCSGCKICVNLCPYKAISFHEETGKASINAVLCCGCGTCVAACPIDAIKGSHFTSKQIIAEIKGALN